MSGWVPLLGCPAVVPPFQRDRQTLPVDENRSRRSPPDPRPFYSANRVCNSAKHSSLWMRHCRSVSRSRIVTVPS